MFQRIKQRFPRHKLHNFSDRKSRIFDFLSDNPVGVLSTVTPDGNPHGTVIYFHLNPDFTVSFLTKAGTRKFDNILHHNHVMLTVFEPKSQATAQVIGTAEETKDSEAVHKLVGEILGVSLKSSEAGTPPIVKLVDGRYAAMTIRPLQIRMAVYERPDSGDYGQLFDSVESYELNEEDC